MENKLIRRGGVKVCEDDFNFICITISALYHPINVSPLPPVTSPHFSSVYFSYLLYSYLLLSSVPYTTLYFSLTLSLTYGSYECR